MLSTLFASVNGHFDLESFAEEVGHLEQAPADELEVKLGKYSTCPGSAHSFANIHTMAQMSVTFTNTCAEVQAEIQARTEGRNGWVDPHNDGTYTMLASDNGVLETKRLTGNRRYTDKQSFAMTATSGGGCNVQACSESQGTSANDGGTNLCDMFDLFCNDQTVNPDNGVTCKSITTNLEYTINSQECGRYVFQNNYRGHRCQNRVTTCLRVASPEHAKAVRNLEVPDLEFPIKLGQYNTCPGNNAFLNIHAMSQMEVQFTNSCAEVSAEIEARANRDDGWHDPHNGGTYHFLNDNNNLLATERRTGGAGLFLDKQTFALSASGSGCVMKACSESQGTSANDGGTNLCDMYNLFCNSSETNSQTGVSCKPIKNDLSYKITSELCGRFVFQNNFSAHQCQQLNPTCLRTNGNEAAKAPQMKELKTLSL